MSTSPAPRASRRSSRGSRLGTWRFSRLRVDARRRLEDLGLLGDHPTFDTNRAAIAELADRTDRTN